MVPGTAMDNKMMSTDSFPSTKVSDKVAYTNNADPDQTAPEGAVWSGSILFAHPLFEETIA